MFVSNRMIQPKEIKINDISENQNYIKIKGKVTKVSTSKDITTFLKLKDDTGSIDVVIFKNSIDDVSWIKAGNIIEVLGKPEKYKNKLEIIASQIKQ